MKNYLYFIFGLFLIFLSTFALTNRTTTFQNTMNKLMAELQSDLSIKKLIEERKNIISEFQGNQNDIEQNENHEFEFDMVSKDGSIYMNDNNKPKDMYKDKKSCIFEFKNSLNSLDSANTVYDSNNYSEFGNLTDNSDFSELFLRDFESLVNEVTQELIFSVSNLCANYSPTDILKSDYNFDDMKKDYNFLLEVECKEKNNKNQTDVKNAYVFFESKEEKMSSDCLRSLFGFIENPDNCICDEYTCSCARRHTWNDLKTPIKEKVDRVIPGKDNHFYFLSKIYMNFVEKRLIRKSTVKNTRLISVFKKLKPINNELNLISMKIITDNLTSDAMKGEKDIALSIYVHFLGFFAEIFDKLDELRLSPIMLVKENKALHSLLKKLFKHIFFICLESHEDSNKYLKPETSNSVSLLCCSVEALKEAYSALRYKEMGLLLLPGKKSIEICNQNNERVLFNDIFEDPRGFLTPSRKSILKRSYEAIEESLNNPKLITKLKINFLKENIDVIKYKDEKYDIMGKISGKQESSV